MMANTTNTNGDDVVYSQVQSVAKTTDSAHRRDDSVTYAAIQPTPTVEATPERVVVIARESETASWGFGISKSRTPQGCPSITLIGKGSPAESAVEGRLRVGDVLVSVNGTATDEMTEKEVTMEIKTSVTLNLVVKAPVNISEGRSIKQSSSTKQSRSTSNPNANPQQSDPNANPQQTATTWFNEPKARLSSGSTDSVAVALAGLKEGRARTEGWGEIDEDERKIAARPKSTRSIIVEETEHPFHDDLNADFSNPLANGSNTPTKVKNAKDRSKPSMGASPFTNPSAAMFGNIKMTPKFG